MRQKETLIVILLLILFGGSIFLYRVFTLDFPLTPNQNVESWHVEYKVALKGDAGPLGFQAFLPPRNNFHTIVDENFIGNDFGMTTRQDQASGNRIVSWTKRHAQDQEILYYRAILYETHSANGNADSLGNKKNTANRSSKSSAHHDKRVYPQYDSPEFKALSQDRQDYLALASLIADIRSRSIDDKSFALDLFSFLSKYPDDHRIVQIQESNPFLSSPAAVQVYILKHIGVSAHVANGIPLASTRRHIDFQSRAELNFHDGQGWVQYNPYHRVFTKDRNFLKWWVGFDPFFKIDGNYTAMVNVAIKKHTENALTEVVWQGDPTRQFMYKLSIFSLPVDIQLVFAVLLLVPLGAIVVCVMRQIIGVETFGTFLPILVALAFRETQLALGVTLFCLVVMLGLFFRAYLNRLQLLIIPRLSAIMIMVVIALYGLSLLAYNANIYTGLSISMFPLVILSMLIERISVSWEEFGAKTTIKATLGSLFVAIISYFVMNNPYLSHLMVTFPELLLIAIAIIIMIGRYNGYKLTEYYRFRMFVDNDISGQKG